MWTLCAQKKIEGYLQKIYSLVTIVLLWVQNIVVFANSFVKSDLVHMGFSSIMMHGLVGVHHLLAGDKGNT